MKKLIAISVILTLLLAIVYFIFNTDKVVDPRGSAYAGSASCAKCHSKLYNSYLHTAHYIATTPPGTNTIHGNFAKSLNVINLNAAEKIVMEKRGGQMFQTYYLNGKAIESHPFGVVLGGIKGESYLYWKGNELYQLPVSYYTKLDKWLMSPQYMPGVNFGRVITSRCLECHASYIGDQPAEEQKFTIAEQFIKNTLVYSIDCERCHGPAAQHVEFQTENPGVKTAKFITSFRSLPRARRIDVCAACHSGNQSEMLRPTFRFEPGDTLARFKLPAFEHTIDTAHLDVHGNQLQLLASSKCFINSQMDCTSCHDTHQNQRGNMALFTQKCLNCHSAINHNYCKMANSLNAQLIKSNCIQCHMPALPSKAIMAPTIDKVSSAEILVHTHRIAIYPQEVKKILAMVKGS